MAERANSLGSGRGSEAGYNLVVMVIVITAFNVLVASAWPLWSAFAQRQKEEELIFRGLQYAEAIRVFQKRFGRYPNRLEELVEVEPRCLRQLWGDPMTEDGKWGLILGTAPGGKGGGKGDRKGARRGMMADIIKDRQGEAEKAGDAANQGAVIPGSPPGSGLSSDGMQVAAGPITGVFSKSDESGFKTFFGQSGYSQWKFTVDLVSQPPMGPTGVRTPHIGPRTIGKPFRGDISPPGGMIPGGVPKGRPGPGADGGGKGQPAPPGNPGMPSGSG